MPVPHSPSPQRLRSWAKIALGSLPLLLLLSLVTEDLEPWSYLHTALDGPRFGPLLKNANLLKVALTFLANLAAFLAVALFLAAFIVAFAAMGVGRVSARSEGSADDAARRPNDRDKSLVRRAFSKAVSIAFFFLALVTVGVFLAVNLLGFRMKPKTAEVKSNLGAIRSMEMAYFAEHGTWVGNQPPTPIADRRGKSWWVPWDRGTRFSLLGFAPVEERVHCSYVLDGPDFPAAADGFTARAECDLDGNGDLSVFLITNTSPEIVHTGAPF